MPIIPPDHPHYVPPEGDPNSTIVVLGEAPGRNEHTQKRPFVGWSGQHLFTRILSAAGVQREQCYTTNVCPLQPPRDKIFRAKELGVDLDLEAARTLDHLRTLSPNIVIALGNVASNCVLQRPLDLAGIMDHRGSMFPAQTTNEPFDIFCMIHPAAINRDWKLDAVCKADAVKLRKYITNHPYNDPPRDLYIYGKHIRRSLRSRTEDPLPKSVEYYLNHILTAKSTDLLCIDIETFAETITVFGFATSPTNAVSIPFTGQFTEYEEAMLIEAIRDLLACPMPKVTQNGIYDGTLLADQWQVEIHNHVWDTMLMHHCLYAELPHDLGFLTSIYTDIPFFKKMAKEASSANYNEAQWEYNALDTVATLQAHKGMCSEMSYYNQWDVYWKYYVPLSHTLANMQRRGVAFDRDRREELIAQTELAITNAQQKLSTLVGENFNIKSSTQMSHYVHGILKLPKIKKKGGGFTLDKTARATLKRRFPAHYEFFDLVDSIAQNRDVLSKYLGKLASGKRKYIEDPDNRIRTSYNIAGNSRTDTQTGGAETGRLSSSTNCYNRGCNMQNQPKNIRDLYIPDPGYIMWQADWQSAESYVVAWMANDPGMLKVLTNHRLYTHNGPDKVLMHEAVGEIVTGLPQHLIVDKWRDLAKRCGHARNYGMSPQKLVELVNNYIPEIPFTLQHAKKCMIDLDNAFFGVKEWKDRTRRQVAETRRLFNIFGHMRVFFGRFGDALWREAYSHVPQSSVGVGLNYSLMLIDEALSAHPNTMCLLQVHDSIVGQCTPDMLDHTRKIVCDILERELPCECAGMKLRIPASFSTGTNWKECG